jgi:apolipoprotein N-acyltransferase
LAFFAPLLSWSNLHTGWAPWLLLSGFQAAFVALVGAATAGCSGLLARWWWLWPVVTGSLWTLQETLRSRLPFGGFPWGRLAFGQVDSPLVAFATVGGAPLVTFAVAAAGGCGALLWAVRGWWPAIGAGSVVAGLVGSAALVPFASPDGREVTVAIVQGNVPRLGLDFNEQRRRVLDNHVEGTLSLARRVAAGELPRPDLVVWPENSSDIDPLLNADAADRIDEAAMAVGVPILVGALLVGDGELFNAGLVWAPGRGEVDRYVKRHPVPFAEYMPFRAIARLVSDKVDLLRVEFAPGDRPGVLPVGGVVVGDVICFEVAYDSIVRDVVTGGAQLLAVQTNNATFNRAEARQQLAMVRLRAVEHGRPALMASTVGISGFVGVGGEVSQATGFDVPAVIVERVRLGSTRTVATRLGPWPEYVVAVVGLALLVVGRLVASRRWRWSG